MQIITDYIIQNNAVLKVFVLESGILQIVMNVGDKCFVTHSSTLTKGLDYLLEYIKNDLLGQTQYKTCERCGGDRLCRICGGDSAYSKCNECHNGLCRICGGSGEVEI